MHFKLISTEVSNNIVTYYMVVITTDRHVLVHLDFTHNACSLGPTVYTVFENDLNKLVI